MGSGTSKTDPEAAAQSTQNTSLFLLMDFWAAPDRCPQRKRGKAGFLSELVTQSTGGRWLLQNIVRKTRFPALV